MARNSKPMTKEKENTGETANKGRDNVVRSERTSLSYGEKEPTPNFAESVDDYLQNLGMDRQNEVQWEATSTR